MTISAVVLATVSTLVVNGNTVEGVNQFQATRNQDVRPIYAWNSAYPVLNVSVPAMGQGSFSFVASDGTYSSGTTNWSTAITGTIAVSGSMYPSGTGQTINFYNCRFAGESISMSAQNEMQVNVNFTFTSGTF